MESEASLVVDGYFKGSFHELLADGSHVNVHGGREHLHLFGVGSQFEDRLHVLTHVQGFQHLIALV